ncbi:hypothetical protein TNCV_508261 [Trichonephila clavipes]|nr:hypothetical protein TNCV_508261 [Trichonephila clavipes]
MLNKRDGISEMVTIKIAFQASITAEVPACSEDCRFGWLRNLRSNSSQRDLDRSSEQASTPMCAWSSYPAGREMGLLRNIAIELGVQHCPYNVHIHLRVPASNHRN